MLASLALAALALYVFAVHTFAGQRRVAAPLVASNTRPFSRATLEAVWHATSWFLLVGAAAVAFDAVSPIPSFMRLYGIELAGLTLMFLWVGPRRLGSALDLPQWILVGPLSLALLVRSSPAPVAAILLFALGAVHVAWAFGLAWPAPSRREMSRYLVGTSGDARLPGRPATLAVAVVLLALAAALGLHLRYAREVVVLVFAARGAFGVIERAVRPGVVGTPYALLSRLFYSPLCLFIAALAGAEP